MYIYIYILALFLLWLCLNMELYYLKKLNMMYQEFNWVFKNINNEFKFKLKVYVKITTSKIVWPQKLTHTVLYYEVNQK